MSGILNDKERAYLRAVIKRWREELISIYKVRLYEGDFISISLKNGEIVYLDWVKRETMYKGMKVGKKYSLNELGL